SSSGHGHASGILRVHRRGTAEMGGSRRQCSYQVGMKQEMRTKSMTTASPEAQALPAGATVGPDAIMALAAGYRAARVLLSAVELGVFTALAESPLDLDALRARIEISDRGARDFFDSLVALKLAERDESGRYRNVPAADLYLDRCKPTYI